MTDYTTYKKDKVTEAPTSAPAEIQNESEGGLVVERVGHIVNCRNVNVRKGPNKNADVLDVLPVGFEVEILKNQGKGWITISTEKIPKGYIMEEFVKEI